MMTNPFSSQNLFVYGSLREPTIFESVCGLSFTLKPSHAHESHILYAELAILNGYRRVSPDNVYYYAVAEPSAKIEGFVIYQVPPAAMKEIDRYEGKLYGRETVRVNTANGPVEAQAYLASSKTMKQRFGDRFHVNLIHELWLRKRIEKFFETHTRPGETSMDADVERRAHRELLGTTERDLVISHLGHDAVSDYFLEHELDRPIPSIRHLYTSKDAAPVLENYLALVVKQVLLNQFEWNLHHRFRFELDRISPSTRYYTRIVSLLIALRMINTSRQAVEMIVRRCLETLPADGSHDLVDYVKYAVHAADSMFDARMVQSELQIIRNNIQPGLVPMGVELELSNLGFRAVHKDAPHQQEMFMGFRFFEDFALDILTWKMGGYIDNHSDNRSMGKQGFLELAPGRLNIAGELSKPATGDPWILNQLIRETAAFYPVRPHSLHLSFQMRKYHVGKQNVLPLSFVKCLFVLGGGTEKIRDGRLWVSRMGHDEIRQNRYGEELVFARTSKRRSRMSADPLDNRASKPTYVHQYKFIRLDPRANYEPLIMALKGLQLSMNPGDYLTAEQLSSSRRLRHEYEELKEWSQQPAEISRRTKGRFLDAIYDGLMHEAHNRPCHKLHYIDWAIGAIDFQLRMFNKQFEETEVKPPVAIRRKDPYNGQLELP